MCGSLLSLYFVISENNCFFTFDGFVNNKIVMSLLISFTGKYVYICYKLICC